MSVQANYFKIGLFVILGITVLVFGVIVLGAGSILQKSTTMETYFDGSVQGLDIGSPVKFRGVQIGRVSEIAPVSWVYDTSSSYILVRAKLDANNNWFQTEQSAGKMFAEQTELGLRVRLAEKGLTGTVYLEVNYLDPRQIPPVIINWEPKYPYLPSAPSVITQLSDSLTRIMRTLEGIKMEGISTRLEMALDTIINTLNDLQMAELSNEAKDLLVELRATNKNLDKMIAGINTQGIMDDAKATVEGARRIVENTEKPLAEWIASLKKATRSIDVLASKLDSTSSNLPQAVAQAEATLKRMDDLLTIPQQNLAETLDNIRLMSQNLKELTENTKRYPSYLLFGEPPARVFPGGRRR